eukprot:tig00020848_g14569.t1
MGQHLPLLLGTAMLLPWNAIMGSFDYLQTAFPARRPAFDTSWLYQASTLGGALLCFNPTISLAWSVRSRIAVPLAAFVALFIAVPALPPGSDSSYTALLVLVAASGVATAVLQQSLLAWAASAGREQLVAVVQGNAVSGILICGARVASKLALPASLDGLRQSVVVYFALAAGFSCLCLWAFLRAAPGEQPVAHVHAEEESTLLEKAPPPTTDRSLSEIAWIVRYPLLSTFSTFLVSLALFPAFALAAPCPNGISPDWNVLLIISDFCIFDLIGRLLAKRLQPPGLLSLALFTLARSLLALPLLLAASPAGRALLPSVLEPTSSPLTVPLLVAIVASTSGFAITAALAQAPPLVSLSEHSCASTLMAVALNGGLTAGALVANALQPLVLDSA